MNKVFLWTLITIVISAALYASGTGLQILAGIMTIVLHPWILAPIVVLAVLLVIIWNAMFNKKED